MFNLLRIVINPDVSPVAFSAPSTSPSLDKHSRKCLHVKTVFPPTVVTISTHRVRLWRRVGVIPILVGN